MWRFVHLTDPHLASSRDGEWNNLFLCSMMPEVMRVLRHDLAQLQPEFILATGDIVSTQTREAMFEARDEMDSLGVPYWPMGGNHDFVLQESREWFLTAFQHRLPQRSTYYSFTHRNLHFCVLDAWWLWADGSLCEVSPKTIAASMDTGLAGARWAVPPEQFAWLEQDLSAHADVPTIVAVHYPATPLPKRLIRPGLRDGGSLENGELLLQLLTQHPHVFAIFSGHQHMHVIERTAGITQVVTGALPEFPTEYREVRVFADHVEIVTHGLSDPQYALRSLIPGRESTAGEPQDRHARVMFRGR